MLFRSIVCMYVFYFTFCIMMMMYQDDKNECGLGVIVKTAHVKRKKTVISLLSATSRWSEIGMQARGSFLLVKNNTTKKRMFLISKYL